MEMTLFYETKVNSRKMQNAQKDFEEYCVQWRLQINPKKEKLIIFRETENQTDYAQLTNVHI